MSGEGGSNAAASDGWLRVREVGLLFLRLGTTAFGGPAAHVALMEHEVVTRRGWVTRAEFLDLLGATNLIPGPNSTEMAIHLGRVRAGWMGLVVAGVCFIAPAAVLVTAMAWAYVRYGAVPAVGAILHGIKPVMLAIVVQALWTLGRVALKDGWVRGVALAACVLNLAGVNELVLLVAGGGVLVGWRAARSPRAGTRAGLAAGLATAPWFGAAAMAAPGVVPFSLGSLFLLFLKTGAVLFGSGYVLLAFLRADFVEGTGWLTEAQLLDAIAVGQMTPGPVLTTATFIGYLLGGVPGAVLATLGIFLPAFVFVAVSSPWIPRLRRSASAGAFLDGVNAVSLALMAAVTLQLARSALVDVATALMALVAAVLLIRYRLGATLLIASGALVGWLVAP